MTKPRIMILGAAGSLATQVANHFRLRGSADIVALTRAELDITDSAAVRSALQRHNPIHVLNAAAFLNTERCEEQPDASYAINYKAAHDVARAVADFGAILFHISTDFVFDGRTGDYDEESPARPLNFYGLHKYMADQAILADKSQAYILRVASVIGADQDHHDFIKSLLKHVAKGRTQLTINDEFEISVSTNAFIADVIDSFIALQPSFGLYNCVGKGATTWCGLAREAFAALNLDTIIEGVPASAYPLPTPRPPKSSLSTIKLERALVNLPSWQQIVRQQIRQLETSYRKVLQSA